MTTTDLIDALRGLVNDKRITKQGWSLLRPVIESAARRHCRINEVSDVVQEVMLKLMGGKRALEAESNGAAVSYLRRATRSVVIDRNRRADVRPKASDQADVDDPYAHIIVGHEESDVTWDDQAQLLEDLLDRVRGELDTRIAQSGKPVLQRELASKQAEATLLARVGGLESKQIAIELGVPSAKSDALAKWVERGRPWVLAAIDVLAKDATDEEAKAFSNLRELAARRRKDAGVSRSTTSSTASSPAKRTRR